MRTTYEAAPGGAAAACDFQPGPALQDLVSGTSELASLPDTTVKLLRLLDDATVEAGLVSSVIDKDPALTANLLKLCNSAYYGMRRQVGSVHEAAVLLGNRTIVTLAFATSMGDILRGALHAYGMERDDMWRHSLATALAASRLVVATGQGELKDRAFTAGLVHDIGKFLLDRALGEAVDRLPQNATGEQMLEAERRILGFDHCEAGAALATAWNFPEMLVVAIHNHHRPDARPENGELLIPVHAANLVAGSLGLGGNSGRPVPLAEVEGLADRGIPGAVLAETATALVPDLEHLIEGLH